MNAPAIPAMRCEMRVSVAPGFEVPAGFRATPNADRREFRGELTGDYRNVALVAAALNANAEWLDSKKGDAAPERALTYFPHPIPATVNA